MKIITFWLAACPFRKFHPAWIRIVEAESSHHLERCLRSCKRSECSSLDLFKSRRRLEAENLFLRHQLNIALRRAAARLRLRGSDRALLVWMTRLWPSLLDLAQVVQPETILRWHRSGFRAFWRWKSRNRAGRPKIDRGLRDLIQRMSRENPLWGASRIHGELLMLGFEVAQSTVSKYIARASKPPSQTWKTFLRNHAEAIAAIDMCVVPTLTFDRLFAFLVLGHGRRQLLWFEVTRHPTAEWLARQITEAFPWTSAPAYLVRDNDRAYGHVFTSRVRAMGIRDRPISPGSPWQNGICGTSDWHTASRVSGPNGHHSVRRTCGEFFPPMQHITIKHARTWHYRKMRHCAEPSNGLAPLSPFRSWPGCITNMSGYDFRKGQFWFSDLFPSQPRVLACFDPWRWPDLKALWPSLKFSCIAATRGI